ncbi:MAG: GFA family protein [Gammaproteobacteria bacterium]|nr:GFA family protein [Gammaproteobacteria bacterium]
MALTGYRGGCLCGNVRYQASGAARHLCYCHCTSCRRAAGAPVVSWATFASEHFRVTKGTLSEFRSSPQVLRGFCAACGSSLTWRSERQPAEIDVALATLDDAAHVVPQMHVWVSDKLPWTAITDGLPQFPEGSPPGQG